MGPIIKNAKISVEIFGCYAVANLIYQLDGSKEGELSLPFVPSGTVFGFSVYCDGKPFASARGVNLREMGGTIENAISLSRRLDGAMVVSLSSLPSCKETEISLSVCFKLSRRANHASISFCGFQGESFAPATLSFKINEETKKVSSPTHKITEEVSATCTTAFAEASLYNESFILDIFFKENQPNGVVISRHPLRDNVALCTFTPRLSHLLGEATDFEIYLLPEKEALSKCIPPLSVLLSSLGERNRFRVFLNGKCAMDFAFATKENVDFCIDKLLNSKVCGFEPCQNSKKIVIACGTASLSTGISPDLIILYDGARHLSPMGHLPCVCVSEADMGSIIPISVAKLFSARVSPVFLEPVGGLGVKLLPSALPEAAAGEVSFCFAQHSVIPPKKIRLCGENWSEEVSLDSISTQPSLLPIDIMYALEMVKALEKEKSTLPYEVRCVLRDKINEICISYGISFGDVSLVCFSGDAPVGFIDNERAYKENLKKFFGEDTFSSAPEILFLVLSAQTTEGIIANDLFQREDMLVFSTAVSLIALYLYTKDRYYSFAKRSLEFLRNKDGYWARTALSLWENGEIDFNLLF